MNDIPRCKYTMSQLCDHKSSIVSLVLEIVFLIPFLYIAVKLIRGYKLHIRSNIIPGVSYCLAFVIFNVLTYFYYYVFYPNQHDRIMDTFSRTTSIMSDLYLMALVQYFQAVSKILIISNVLGSKIIYYITKFTVWFFFIGSLIKLVLIFINFPYEINFHLFSDYGFYYNYIIVPSEFIIDGLSFVLLSITFIFSNVRSFLAPAYRMPVKVCMFLMPLFITIVIVSVEISTSKYFEQIKYSNPSKYMYYFTYLLFTHRMILDLVYLAIIYFMSIQQQDYGVREYSQSVIEQSFSSMPEI